METILEHLTPLSAAFLSFIAGITIGGITFFAGYILGSIRGYRDGILNLDDETINRRLRKYSNFSSTETIVGSTYITNENTAEND